MTYFQIMEVMSQQYVEVQSWQTYSTICILDFSFLLKSLIALTSKVFAYA